MKTIGHLILLVAAAAAGAAVGDLVRQRVAGQKGSVLFKDDSGSWKFNLPPQALIPAVVAGFRSKERGLIRAAGISAFMAATGGQKLGGIAGSFFPKRGK